MNVTPYADDAEVLRLADAAGCGMSLRAASKDYQTTIIIVDTLFIAHNGGGYSAFRVDDVRDMPVLLEMLAPVLGPIQHARLQTHDNAPPPAGETRH